MILPVLFQSFTSLKQIPESYWTLLKKACLSVLYNDYLLMLVPMNLQQVCGHKWVDLSEHDWGVALMTDCKYGYSTHANVMYISL